MMAKNARADRDTFIAKNARGGRDTFIITLDGQKSQSLAFSECGQLSRAMPQFHVERMLNE